MVASDYVRAVPSQITPYLEAKVTLLGTDGFGRSASRVDLRQFFEVDSNSIALAALDALVCDGQIDDNVLNEARSKLQIQSDPTPPWKK